MDAPPPLDGIRVVDLSRLLPGPWCTWLLSSLGAEVIRVEDPAGSDYTRTLPPVVEGTGVFFAALLVRDGRRVTLRKVAAFCGGAVVFAVFYLPINILPALDTIRQHGLMPQTYSSSSNIPILHEPNPWSALVAGARGYWRFFRQPGYLESQLIYFTAGFCALAIGALCFKPNRLRWCTATVVIAIIIMMLFVFPVRRQEYVFYVLPPLFVLTTVGLMSLPIRWLRYSVVGVVTAVMAGVYVWGMAGALEHFHRVYPHNRKTGAVLRELVNKTGAPAQVKVMGVQAFHPFVEPAAYRTYHSLLATGDMRVTLRQIQPDIVVIDRRGINVIGLFLGTWRNDRPTDENVQVVVNKATQALGAEGYRLYETEPLTWNDQRVAIFHRPR